ncbi:ubiquitin-related domain-containing protein, partial [Trichophaea hybrida]
FQAMHSEVERLEMSKAILTAHPDYIPVILQTPTNPYRKLSVPRNIQFSEFAYQRHRKMGIAPEKAAYFLVADELPMLTWTMAQVYEEYADFDRFLYITMCEENTFG